MVSLVLYWHIKMFWREQIISSLLIVVNVAQFWQTVGLFSNGNFWYKTLCQWHITAFYNFTTLVLLQWVFFLQLISPPWNFKSKILKLQFTVRFPFICIFYGSIHILLYTCATNLSGDIKKNPGLALLKSFIPVMGT